MTVVFAMLAIIALYWGASFYLKKATQYVAASEAVWDRLYAAAQEVVSDPDMPDRAASFATASVMCAGCGCLTRQLLQDKILASLGLRKLRTNGSKPHLSDEQWKVMNKVVINAIYYDSLRAPLMGFMLRRIAFPWLRAASEGRAPVKRAGATMMAAASVEAISHREEGRKLLAA